MGFSWDTANAAQTALTTWKQGMRRTSLFATVATSSVTTVKSPLSSTTNPNAHTSRPTQIRSLCHAARPPDIKPKFRVLELDSEDRVLAPGKNYQSKNGNRKAHLLHRLDAVIGRRPSAAQGITYPDKNGKPLVYGMRDCKYDLDRGYLQLEDPDTKTGVASIFFAERPTPADKKIHGTLTQAVTQSLTRIDHQSTKRRDIDGGITVDKHRIRPAAQPLLHDQTVPITRDEKAMIVKADYLGLTSGTNIEISHGKETSLMQS